MELELDIDLRLMCFISAPVWGVFVPDQHHLMIRLQINCPPISYHIFTNRMMYVTGWPSSRTTTTSLSSLSRPLKGSMILKLRELWNFSWSLSNTYIIGKSQISTRQDVPRCNYNLLSLVLRKNFLQMLFLETSDLWLETWSLQRSRWSIQCEQLLVGGSVELGSVEDRMRLQQLYKYNWISSATFNSLIRLEVCGTGVMIMVILLVGGGEGSGLLYDDLDDTWLMVHFREEDHLCWVSSYAGIELWDDRESLTRTTDLLSSN